MSVFQWTMLFCGTVCAVLVSIALTDASSFQSPAPPTSQHHRLRRASLSKPLPYDDQNLGYQFYAALPIPPELRDVMVEQYGIIAEIEQHTERNEKPGGDMAVRLSQTIFDTIQGANFDQMRKEAAEFCEQKQNKSVLRRDPCTQIRFSPFELVCEVMVVVTTECMNVRENAIASKYDAVLLDMLRAPTTAPQQQQPEPKKQRIPEPEQSYEDFVERRSRLRAAARNLQAM